MCNEEPDIKFDATYGVKETCAILQVSKNTLAKRRKSGMIKPVNPDAQRWFRYTGKAIRNLWRVENHFPI